MLKPTMQKPIIYQMLPRLWGNDNSHPVKNGTLTENGTGKFSDIDQATLDYIKWLGCTHVKNQKSLVLLKLLFL